MQFGPDACAGAENQQTHAFPAVSQRHHKKARATVLARVRIAHHRTGTVIDLRFFTRGSLDHRTCFRCRCSTQLAYEALDALIARAKAVTVDQFLPDRLGVSAKRKASLDQLSIGFTGTRRWAARRDRSGDRYRRRLPARV